MPAPDYNKVQQIRALKAQGLNQSEIANELNCCQANISKICKTHSITWDAGAAARDQRGDKNPNYQGGNSRSTVERLTRRAVSLSGRNLFVCERCGNNNQFREQIRHHRDRDRSNNDNSNLEVLCVSCHNIEHAKERVRDVKTGRFVA